MRLNILFGAGISLPARMPSTKEITDRILSCEKIYRHSSEVYCLGEEPSLRPDQTYMNRIKIGLHKTVFSPRN